VKNGGKSNSIAYCITGRAFARQTFLRQSLVVPSSSLPTLYIGEVQLFESEIYRLEWQKNGA
jgi:hypothetical protein